MVFSSLLFLFRFLPIVLILYFAVPQRFRNAVLFFSSLVFYAWGEPIYVTLMIFSTVVDYTHGLLVERFKEKGDMKKAKLVVLSSATINLALLGFFKYADFVITNINSLLGTDIAPLELALPIGISFYTFQTMSYTIDVYRGQATPQKNIISFGAYVALFPQLIAGPIVQYKTIAEQLRERKESVDEFSYGMLRFMAGLGKKVLLANNIGLLWDTISARSPEEIPALMAWLGITAFAFQIYFDFSGYSDMAIGLGHIFGFRFLENFHYPYQSKSITEFWRRWHISLGSWFRDYVYIPLGGNRKGLKRQVINVAVVWMLTGIWHGASWNFLFWGIYFGALIIVEKWFLLKRLEKLPSVVSHVYTLFLVWIGWVIFAFDNSAKGFAYLQSMFGLNGNGFVSTETMYLLCNYAVMLILLILAATEWPKRLALRLLGENPKTISTDFVQNYNVRFAVCTSIFVIGIFLLSVAYLVDASYNPFLYFRF